MLAKTLQRARVIAVFFSALALGTATAGFAQDSNAGLAAEAAPTSAASAQPPPANDSAGLAKQLANPIASLISVPFQENFDFGLGPNHDGFRSILNIQPVIPISLSDSVNVISRTILPVIYLDARVAGHDKFGLGDIVQSLFFSPKRPTSDGIVWGAGPVLSLPTATDPALGSGKWGIGPTVVALKQSQGFTYGALVNQIWSVAGNRNRVNVSQVLLQPFLNYTWPSAVTLGLNSETLYNWKLERWSVPFNLSISKIVLLGSQRASIQAGIRYYVEHPEGGPDWGGRLTFTLLFPKH